MYCSCPKGEIILLASVNRLGGLYKAGKHSSNEAFILYNGLELQVDKFGVCCLLLAAKAGSVQHIIRIKKIFIHSAWICYVYSILSTVYGEGVDIFLGKVEMSSCALLGSKLGRLGT
jgi:hypothetical protein